MASARQIREVVARLNRERGTTVFLTTHNVEEADLLCHRVAIIDRGHLAAIDTPVALRHRVDARRSAVVSLAGTAPELTELLPNAELEAQRLVDGWRIFSREPGPLAQAIAVRCAEQALRVESIATQAPALEEVCLSITGADHGRR